MGGREPFGEAIEGRGPGGEVVLVAGEGEAGIDAGGEQVGEVLEVEGGEVARGVVAGERTEPGEIGAVQPGTAGEEGGVQDTRRERPVAPLEEADHRVDTALMVVPQGQRAPGGLGQLLSRGQRVEDLP